MPLPYTVEGLHCNLLLTRKNYLIVTCSSRIRLFGDLLAIPWQRLWLSTRTNMYINFAGSTGGRQLRWARWTEAGLVQSKAMSGDQKTTCRVFEGQTPNKSWDLRFERQRVQDFFTF